MSENESQPGETSCFTVEATRDVVLVRHGETDWNKEWRLQGTRDVPLNDTGREQMRWVGEMVSGGLGTPEERQARSMPSIWSSPVLRARESADIIADTVEATHPRGVGAVREHAGLREFDMGRFTGELIWSLQDDPDWQAYLENPADAVFPGGEAMPDIRRRACDALQNILDQDESDTLIVVSHGGIVRVLAITMLGIPDDHFLRFKIGNASITRVRLMPPNRLRVLSLNMTQRLRGLF